jgi:hypothetical protein
MSDSNTGFEIHAALTEEYCPMGCDAMQSSRGSLLFLRNICLHIQGQRVSSAVSKQNKP